MWIASKLGFYSIVRDPQAQDQWKIRARVKKDLANLIKAVPLKDEAAKIVETTNTDYRYRVFVSAVDLVGVFDTLMHTITYGNFKSSLKDTDQEEKHGAYLQLWSIMQQFQPKQKLNHPWGAKRQYKSKADKEAQDSVIRRFKSQIPSWEE